MTTKPDLSKRGHSHWDWIPGHNQRRRFLSHSRKVLCRPVGKVPQVGWRQTKIAGVRPTRKGDLVFKIRGDSNKEASTSEVIKAVRTMGEVQYVSWSGDSELGLLHPGGRAPGSSGKDTRKARKQEYDSSRIQQARNKTRYCRYRLGRSRQTGEARTSKDSF